MSDECLCGCAEPLTDAELKLISTQLRLKEVAELLQKLRNEDLVPFYLKAKVDKFLKEPK